MVERKERDEKRCGKHNNGVDTAPATWSHSYKLSTNHYMKWQKTLKQPIRIDPRVAMPSVVTFIEL